MCAMGKSLLAKELQTRTQQMYDYKNSFKKKAKDEVRITLGTVRNRQDPFRFAGSEAQEQY